MDLYEEDMKGKKGKKMFEYSKTTTVKPVPVMRVWLVWMRESGFDSVDVLVDAFGSPSEANEFAEKYQKQMREEEGDEGIEVWVTSTRVNTENPEMTDNKTFIVNVDFVIKAHTAEDAKELVECYIYDDYGNTDLCVIPPVINHVDEM
jgi:hypothetical protein